MSYLKGIRMIIFPARDLQASITASTQVLGNAPTYQTPDFAAFFDGDHEVGLSRLPWVETPWFSGRSTILRKLIVHWLPQTLGRWGGITGGSMAEIGKSTVTHGNPTTGIVDVPGRRLAVLKAADGNLIGILQELPLAWS